MPFNEHQPDDALLQTEATYDEEFLSPEQRADAIAEVLASIALDALRQYPVVPEVNTNHEEQNRPI